jgi:transcriptional regulator with XRE-family HTH domain
MMQGSLARKLRVLRAERGLSQERAAKMIGVGQLTLSELERGKRTPYGTTLSKLAAGYGVPVEELLEDDPVPLGSAPESGREALLRELGEHLSYVTSRFGEEMSRLEQESGTREEWERLEREAAFTAWAAHRVLIDETTDESGSPVRLPTEAERQAWRRANRAAGELDALCDELEAAAAAAGASVVAMPEARQRLAS